MSAKDYVMPWGKYKNVTLDNIPLKYLDWLVGETRQEPTKTIIAEYLADPVIKKELDRELDI